MGPYYERATGNAAMGRYDVTRTSCLSGVEPFTKAWKSAHNEYTRIDANDGSTIVRYHTTDILEISSDGSRITINVGDYLTQSTMKHLKDALRRHGIAMNCSRAKGVLSLGWPNSEGQWWQPGFTHVCDGYCVLVRDGETWRAVS